MKTPKFSFGSWAFSFGPFADDPWSFDRFVDYAVDAGYDGIEIVPYVTELLASLPD